MLIAVVQSVKAQNTNSEKAKAIIEKQVEMQESVSDYSQLEDDLMYLIEHKININKITEDGLLKLPLIKPQEAKAIVLHRIQFGDFFSCIVVA